MSVRTPGRLHKSLVQTIVETIEEWIVQGELKPGERLTEQNMCGLLDVSRSPLREAFRVLENQGFLVNRARRGVFVANLTKKEAIDIYTIRANLESLATFLSVKAGDTNLARDLKSVNSKMRNSVLCGDIKGYEKTNSEFHERLISACGNDLLVEMLRRFNKQTARYRKKILYIEGKPEESVRKHEALIKSIEDGDAVKAERLRKESILKNIALIERIFLNKDEEACE